MWEIFSYRLSWNTCEIDFQKIKIKQSKFIDFSPLFIYICIILISVRVSRGYELSLFSYPYASQPGNCERIDWFPNVIPLLQGRRSSFIPIPASFVKDLISVQSDAVWKKDVTSASWISPYCSPSRCKSQCSFPTPAVTVFAVDAVKSTSRRKVAQLINGIRA